MFGSEAKHRLELWPGIGGRLAIGDQRADNTGSTIAKQRYGDGRIDVNGGRHIAPSRAIEVDDLGRLVLNPGRKSSLLSYEFPRGALKDSNIVLVACPGSSRRSPHDIPVVLGGGTWRCVKPTRLNNPRRYIS